MTDNKKTIQDTVVPNTVFATPGTAQSVSVRWLVLWICIGFACRLMASILPPAYLDEAFNYALCKAGAFVVIKELASDFHTPIIQLLACPFMRWIDGIWVLRLPSVVLGTVGIYLSFLLSRRFLSVSLSLCVAALTACSYHTWFNDALFRPYGLLAVFALIVRLGMLDIEECGVPFIFARRWHYRLRWISFALCCMALSSLHIIGALLLFSCGLLALFLPSNIRKSTVLCLIAAVIPCLLWFIGTRMWAVQSPGEPYPGMLATISLSMMMAQYVCDLDVLGWLCGQQNCIGISGVVRNFGPVLCGLCLFALIIRGWYRTIRVNHKAWKVMLLGISIFTPLLVLTVGSILGFMGGVQVRYAAPVTVPCWILLLLGLGGDKLAVWFARLSVCASLLVIAIFPVTFGLWCQYWDGATQFIDATKQPGDVVVVCCEYASYSFAWAYDREQCRSPRVIPLQYSWKPNRQDVPVVPFTKRYLDSLIRSPQCEHFYLLLNQSGADGFNALNDLRPYFGVVNEYGFCSFYGWGNVLIYELQRYDKGASKS